MERERSRRRRRGGDQVSTAPPGMVRLQRFLNDCGVASRRRAEEMILEGRVLVNDLIVDKLPAFIDPQRDKVIVNGARVHLQPPVYFIAHKPKNYVCTTRDPAGRPRAIDLVPPDVGRLFLAGRLDEESTGLLLLTNDGELAARVTHPRFAVPKLYRVEVRGQVGDELPEQLKKGVWIEGGKAQALDAVIIHKGRSESVVHLTLGEVRTRELGRIFARLGYKLRKIKRLMIGPLSVKGLPLGASRRLSGAEIHALRAAVGLTEGGSAPALPDLSPRPRRTQSAPARDARRDTDWGGRKKSGFQRERSSESRPPRADRGKTRTTDSGKPPGKAPSRPARPTERPERKRRLID